MSTKNLAGIWIGIAFILSAAALPSAQVSEDVRALVTFQRAVDDYAFLHRRIERQQPAIEISADAATLDRAIESMAAAVRAERADAREGDLFTAAVRPVFRARIAAALQKCGLHLSDLEDAEAAASPAVRLHDAMPWRTAAAVPAGVLAVLPELPPELQYRFVAGDLVLVDVHASLIVDILRGPASDTR